MDKDVSCSCPGCGQHLAVPEEMSGQSIQCPSCHKNFVIEPLATNSAAPFRQPVRKPMGLSQTNLTLSKESVYLTLVVIISVILWLLAIVTIMPILIALFVAIAIWFANGLFVARLKAEAIKVDAAQLPGLAATLQDVCHQLSIEPVPDLYVVQSGGLLNAFTSKHAGRNFVVVYSELLETYGPDSPEIRFLLGHELGHIRRRHILKLILLAPGLMMPLLGSAYSRACEASCDRHGAFASGDVDGSINAMMILAGGKHAKRMMNPVSFAEQYRKFRGFFVSWHELISGYPTLSQRVSNLLALTDGRVPFKASRTPVAYIFAFFSFGGHGGGGANILITVAVIGLLASIAIPSFMKAREVSQNNACINNMRSIEAAKEQAAFAKKYKNGKAITKEEVAPYMKNYVAGFLCPKGGRYTINPVGKNAECSVHGQVIDGDGYPAAPNTHSTSEFIAPEAPDESIPSTRVSKKQVILPVGFEPIDQSVTVTDPFAKNAPPRWEDTRPLTPVESMQNDLEAATKGDEQAQCRLGDAYSNGKGVAKNDVQATKWYRMAAEQGNIAAQYNLGVNYERGEGVSQNYSEAVGWYKKSADKGFAAAQLNLGIAYLHGNGVIKNSQEAAKWFRMAAKQGDDKAQFALGVCYEDGDGLPKDLRNAYGWYILAAAEGNQKALKESLHIEGQLSMEEKATVQAWVKAWKPVNSFGDPLVK
jgi:Zn-dependent protease with chaperone function/type II secretory pathway pseudopilin PulG